MPITLDASPSSPAANAFADVAWADAYFAAQLYSEEWETATADQKAQALITATRSLARLRWDGWPATAAQPLPFPRTGLLDREGRYSIPSGIFPEDLKAATAEAAKQYLADGQLPSTPLETTGIHRLKAGSVEVEYEAGGAPQKEWVSDLVLALIGQWLVGFRRGMISVPLVRA